MVKDYCPFCCRNTNHSSLFKKTINSSQNDDFYWSKDYEIIQCNGCDNIQFRTVYEDESMRDYDEFRGEIYYEDKDYFPKNLLRHNSINYAHEIPVKIRIVYFETVEALKNKIYLLAGVGLRAVIEAICLEQNIPGRNLEIKINKLVQNNLITKKDASLLHSIRFLGNDSVHEMAVPNEQKLRIALDIIESLLKNLYLIDIDANKHLDTMISNYDDFKRLIIKKFVPVPQHEEKSLREVLGKDFRRIEQTYIPNFTQELVDDINNNVITFISIGQIQNSSVENTPVQHFKKN
ncbi:hypothetical protein J2787_003690 [Chryseobacterium rhizosphaerae]|uniref:DUF4145 domain-containing protein n=1 Tax=Chryseobacterium rhizosphaerae TaxID=395937 RepID=A0AAE4C370_9FLAO|nr:DUF4145 domain-containing protein [Chryseobacterium rhizosphaerae]MDR6528271.1 hypothetical protein [Chryseobacterium rhizosphaerae]